MSEMVAKNLAVYEPAKQTRSVLLYWRLPEEWAEVLHEWVCPGDGAVADLRLFALITVVFQPGILNRSAQYHHDLLRDRGASYPLRTFESAGSIVEEGDCDLGEDREGTGYHHC